MFNDLIRQFTSKEHGPLVQFIKYGLGGLGAVIVHTIAFYLAAAFILPCLGASDRVAALLQLPVVEISDALRARNASINNFIAFIFSNFAAYLINIKWVFHAGRHHWAVEIGMFYLVSGVSMLIGTAIMGLLIAKLGWTTTIAFSANIVSSVMINFVMRKFVIFKG